MIFTIQTLFLYCLFSYNLTINTQISVNSVRCCLWTDLIEIHLSIDYFITVKYVFIGNSNNSLFDTLAYESYGIVFKIVSIILWSSVFGTLFNWIYKLISSNYNPKVHLSIIGVQILILLFIL